MQTPRSSKRGTPFTSSIFLIEYLGGTFSSRNTLLDCANTVNQGSNETDETDFLSTGASTQLDISSASKLPKHNRILRRPNQTHAMA